MDRRRDGVREPCQLRTGSFRHQVPGQRRSSFYVSRRVFAQDFVEMPRVQPMSGTDGVDIVVVERLPLFEILNDK